MNLTRSLLDWIRTEFPGTDPYWNSIWDRMGHTLVSSILIKHRGHLILSIQFHDNHRIVLVSKGDERRVITHLANPESFGLIRQILSKEMICEH